MPVQEKAGQTDPRSKDGRTALAKMVMKLFDHWRLSVQQQAAMLGLSEDSRMTILRYRKGSPLADSRDLLDRVGTLLAIHRSLRVLFPRNRDVVYGWPLMQNRAFDGKTPVDVIREEGFLGLLTVKRYLDLQRGT